MAIAGMVVGLYEDPVMRANLGFNILKEDKSPTQNILGAAILTDAFKSMRGARNG